MLKVSRKKFEELVAKAIETLPPFFREKLQNVEVVIEDAPGTEMLEEMGMDPKRDTLYGLYEGTPLTERDSTEAWQLPDKITIFRVPLLEDCESEKALVEEVQITVVHEFAHFFGIEEDALEEMGWD
jgi:predicted Zn-dependent protease with MMP-like domain